MKTFLTTALGCLLFTATAAAQTDSISVVTADWKSEKIAPGIKLKQAAFNKNLFSSNQYISILEIKQRKRNQIKIGYEPQKRVATSEFGKRDNALAAINGTFFDVAKGGSVDYLRADGQVVHTNRLNKDNSRAIHQKAAVVINDGKARIEEWDGTENWEEKIQGEDVMLSGPLLLDEGQEKVLDSTPFVKLRHPRSVVATRKNKLYFITIDGRSENAAGMSLTELADVMRWLKYQDALNLDGGGSTALWVDGVGDNGIVNYPSDNKKWDHDGERKVANVLLVKKPSRR